MSGAKLFGSLINVYLVFCLVSLGFIGLLVFEGVNDKCSVLASQTIIVDCNGNGDYIRIQDAIDNATVGDTIYVWDGKYYESIIIKKQLTLIGNGSKKTMINGTKSNSIFISSNNVIIKKFRISRSGFDYYNAAIKINNSNNCIIQNNYILNSDANGIIIYKGKNNKIINNNISYNDYHGIFLLDSDFNYIENNTCISNLANGINLVSSDSNIILNNTCLDHNIGAGAEPCGIELSSSNFNRIIHNNCSNNYWGIFLTDSINNNTIKDNICFSNRYGIIFGEHESSRSENIKNNHLTNYENYNEYDPHLNSVINNKCQYNSFGIAIFEYSQINIENNNCSDNHNKGITIWNSFNITIENNICSNNRYYGIEIKESSFNIINNNSCNNNSEEAIYIEKSAWNTIFNNFCSWNNGSGIKLISSDNNVIETNTCNFNGYFDSGHHGIVLRGEMGSDKNMIINNTCNSNSQAGIFLLGSANNDVTNNKCSLNDDEDIAIVHSRASTVKNNTCNLSSEGIVLFNSQNIYMSNNSISSTYYAIRIDNSDSNTIEDNICCNNNYGMQLDTNAEYNEIMQNNFSNNEIGMALFSGSNFNRIYDNIISNNSDRGFGIGETCDFNNIFYNIILFNNFQVSDESNNYWNNSDHEGNYWSDYQGLDNGANGRVYGDYIGDTKIPHLGLDNYPFTKLNGWLYPNIPILINPGNLDSDGTYKISWNKSKRSLGYILEESQTELFTIHSIIFNGTNNYFNLSRKEEGIYFYRVKAYNEHYMSGWSNIENISVVYPKNMPPVVNSSLKRIDIFEDSKNIGLINLYNWFIDPNDDVLNFKIKEMKNVSAEILKNNLLSLTPKKDWNGNETLIVSANDTEFEIFDSVVISVIGVNDPPEKPIIYEPLNGTSFSNISKINFTGSCIDVDEIYGDILNYTWISNISGILGYGTKIRNISLHSGKHEIIFKIRDLKNETRQIHIILDIYQLNNTDNITEITNETDTDNDLIPDIWEIKYGLNFSNPIDADLDFDKDNLTNYEEYLIGTNPLNPDSDGDAFKDRIEIENNTDPLDENDYPRKDKTEKGNESEMENYALFIIAGITIIIVLFLLGIFVLIKYKKGKDKSAIKNEPGDDRKPPQMQRFDDSKENG